jgi:transcriptional regulator of met regulon
MARKLIYTKKLGGIVARSAQVLNSGRYHVISGEAQKWVVVPEGSIRVVKVFPTQRQAVNFAKQTASKRTGEVIIHARTGQIKDTISFAKNNSR